MAPAPFRVSIVSPMLELEILRKEWTAVNVVDGNYAVSTNDISLEIFGTERSLARPKIFMCSM